MRRWLPLALLGLTLAVLTAGLVDAWGPLPRAAVLVSFVIVSWALGLFAEPLTTLLFFLLAAVFQVARPQTVFSGFASTAWWLVFGGSMTAIAVQSTGLGNRLAHMLSDRVSGSYVRCVAAVALIAVGLSFLMPSTSGRVLLLMPIILAYADQLGLGPGRPGRTGFILTVALGSYLPSTTILPSNVPNSVLLGAAESIYGIRLTYGPYLLLHFPVLGALKTVALIWFVCRLFPDQIQSSPALVTHPGPISRGEKRLSALLAVSLILFATDFIHGISPAWVSLGTGLACLMPGMSLISPREFTERMQLAMLIYLAGILGLGALVAASGLSELVSDGMLRFFPLAPGHPITNSAILSAIGAGMALLTTVAGLPAVLTPLAGHFAAATGFPLLTVLMLQVVSFSTVFLPFQSPPMMIALQIGQVNVRAAARLTLAVAATTIVVLLPLDYFWWRLLGYLP